MDKILNVAAAIVTVAMVSVIVTGKNTSAVIKAAGDAFANSIASAKG
jgi:hypothetical protein